MSRLLTVILVLLVGCGPSGPQPNLERHAAPVSAGHSAPLRSGRGETSTIEPVVAEEVKASLSPTLLLDDLPATGQMTFGEHPQLAASGLGHTPLVQRIEFSLKSDSPHLQCPSGKCLLTIRDSDSAWSFKRDLAHLERSALPQDAAHERFYGVELFGLQPGGDYVVEISIEIDGESRYVLKETLKFKTAAVSPLFPQLRVTQLQPELMEPGWTLMNLIRWEQNQPDRDFGAIIAVDSGGQLRWSYQASHLIFIVRQLPNGNLLYGYGNRTDGLIEIDLSGHVVRQWDAANLGRKVSAGAIPVQVDSIHHDVVAIDSTTFLTLTTGLHEVPSYFDPTYHPRKRIPLANLVADEVLEMSTSGEVLRRYPLIKLLDPRRIGYGSLHNFWDQRGYEHVAGGTFDWSHANSVVHDRLTDGLIVSVRHQDAVIKIDRKSGELVWILGHPNGWRGPPAKKLLKPVGRPQWPYHQHAVEITPQGALLLFDNGNFRAAPFEKQVHASKNRSRVVEFRVDEELMTVEQVWEYAGDRSESFYSTFLGDVDWLPKTGNVLITNGGEIRDAAGERTDHAPGDQQWAEIYEVTYGANPQRIFELTIKAPQDEPQIGWSVYRSQRIPNLFSKVGTQGVVLSD